MVSAQFFNKAETVEAAGEEDDASDREQYKDCKKNQPERHIT